MKRKQAFFIGWSSRLPKGLGLFLSAVSIFLIGIFAGTAFSFVTTQNNPGDGAFRFDLGAQSVVGTLQAEPYPIIRIPPNEKHPNGHTVMLTGQGKRGVVKKVTEFDGKTVAARGILLKRGALDMLQLNRRGLQLAEQQLAHPETTKTKNLGRWKLSGEICDGKCYAGAMRPGNGLAHKACANLCLSGGVPPIFVIKGAVEGASFFLIGDKNGKPLNDRIFDLTALLIEVEGEIEQRGDLMVFKMDIETAKVR